MLSPAGSFAAGYYAFKAGADAVYCGLPHFSARKSAQNLTFDELAVLKNCSLSQEKKIYVTLNTILTEDELSKVYESICLLQKIAIDGIIIQDPACITLIRSQFPTIPIHASTQMGCYSSQAISVLQQAGVSRIILSREVSFEQMQRLSAVKGTTELEVFIHGALCYSFSGYCLASGLLLNRSGNRGECAQICRTYFQHMQKKGYFFSCNDLSLASTIQSLLSIGIDSYKIEGRMKSPEYVYAVTALYRFIIDTLYNKGSLALGDSKKTFVSLNRDAQLTFSRKQTIGYSHSPLGESLTNHVFPSHLGIEAGHINAVTDTGLKVFLTEDISVRDGVLFFTDDQKAIAGSVKAITIGKKPLFEYKAHADSTDVVLTITPNNPLPPYVKKGTILYKISSRALDLKAVKAQQFKPFKFPLEVYVRFTPCLNGYNNQQNCGQQEPLSLSQVIVSTTIDGVQLDYQGAVPVQKARGSGDFRAVLTRILQESDQSNFVASSVTVFSEIELQPDEIYVAPAHLKRVRNEFYSQIESFSDKMKQSRAAQRIVVDFASVFSETEIDVSLFSQRHLLSPRGDSALLPFVTYSNLNSLENLGRINNYYGIPLHPLLVDNENYLESMYAFIQSFPHERFLVGINNVSHIQFAQRFVTENRVSFFIDFYCYCANRLSTYFYAKSVPRCLFAYYWIEGSQKQYEALIETDAKHLRLVKIDPEFKPPLFMSKACFFRHSSETALCPDVCNKKLKTRLYSGNKHYTLMSDACITYLFLQ